MKFFITSLLLHKGKGWASSQRPNPRKQPTCKLQACMNKNRKSKDKLYVVTCAMIEVQLQNIYLWVKLAGKLFQSAKSFTQVNMSAVKKNAQQRVSGTGVWNHLLKKCQQNMHHINWLAIVRWIMRFDSVSGQVLYRWKLIGSIKWLGEYFYYLWMDTNPLQGVSTNQTYNIIAWQMFTIHLTLKMTSAQVVETSVTNNSCFQNYLHPDDHTIRTTYTPGFKPFTMTGCSPVFNFPVPIYNTPGWREALRGYCT